MSPQATAVAQALGPADMREIDREIRRMPPTERLMIARVHNNRFLVRAGGMQLLAPRGTLRDVVKECAIVEGCSATLAFGMVIVCVERGSLGVEEEIANG